MSEATATIAPELKDLGDKISGLTLKQAKELSDYLKDEYGIEPAAGGGGMMVVAPTDGAGPAPPVQTEFDVVLTGFGDKKLNVVKVVKEVMGNTLMEAKKVVESVPATIKEKLPKDEAEKLKAKLEEAGASIEIK